MRPCELKRINIQILAEALSVFPQPQLPGRQAEEAAGEEPPHLPRAAGPGVRRLRPVPDLPAGPGCRAVQYSKSEGKRQGLSRSLFGCKGNGEM